MSKKPNPKCPVCFGGKIVFNFLNPCPACGGHA